MTDKVFLVIPPRKENKRYQAPQWAPNVGC